MLDFKKFKKVSDDGKVATMAHESGHKISIVKGALSRELQNQLSKLPLHQSSPDSEVKDPNPEPTQNSDTLTDPFSVSSNPTVPQELLNPQPPPAQAPTAQAAPQQGLGQSMMPTDNSNYGALPGYNDIVQGVQGNSKAIAAGEAQKAQLYKQAVVQQQQDLQQFQQHVGSITNEIHGVTEDIKNSHINPNQYLENQGTGAKVRTAIGLMLGSIGSAKTGQPNYAYDFLTKQIDRNLEAQKMDLGKKNNLLSALQQQYGNTIAAENVFRAINANVLADQIGQAASSTNSAVAKSSAVSAIGKLKQEMIPSLIQRSALDQLSKGSGQGGAIGGGMDSATKLNLMQKASIINPEQYKKANEELGIAEKTVNAHKAADEILDQAAKLQTASSRLGSPVQSRQQLAALKAQLVQSIMEASPSKRLTKESMEEEINPLFPGFSSSKNTIEQFKKGIHRMVDAHADSTPTLDGLKSYGVSKPEHIQSVKVQDKNGNVYSLPANQLDKAKTKGYTQVE